MVNWSFNLTLLKGIMGWEVSGKYLFSDQGTSIFPRDVAIEKKGEHHQKGGLCRLHST